MTYREYDMSYNRFDKDPQDTLDYKFNWEDWLYAGDTIVDHEITAGSGIEYVGSAITSGCVIVWLSGGTPGNRYSVACKITTSGSRIKEKTMKIDVKNQ